MSFCCRGFILSWCFVANLLLLTFRIQRSCFMFNVVGIGNSMSDVLMISFQLWLVVESNTDHGSGSNLYPVSSFHICLNLPKTWELRNCSGFDFECINRMAFHAIVRHCRKSETRHFENNMIRINESKYNPIEICNNQCKSF